MARTNARTRASQAAFLAAFEKTCRIDLAAEAANIGRRTHYNWLKTDPKYAQAFADSEVLAAQVLEDTAIKRAVEGWDEPVFQGGEQCGTVRKFSDRLLERLLEARRPEKYRRNIKAELTGKDGEPLIPLAQWRELVRAAKERDAGG
jgi:hypothetical protein